MYFDKCNHHSNHNIEHFLHPEKFLLASSKSILFFPKLSSKQWYDFYHCRWILPILELHIEVIINSHYSIYSFVWLFIKCNAPEIYAHSVHQASLGLYVGLHFHFFQYSCLWPPPCVCQLHFQVGWRSYKDFIQTWQHPELESAMFSVSPL